MKLNFGLFQEIPEILQTESSECGLACLAMIASYHGHQLDLAEVRKLYPISLAGMRLDRIVKIADELGLICRPVRAEMRHLAHLRLPALLHWNLNHYVVLKNVGKSAIVVIDPALGELTLTASQVSEMFTGVAVEMTPGFTFQRRNARSPLELSKLIGKTVGLKSALGQIFLLAAALEFISIIIPLLTQWVTDNAFGSKDKNLLALIALGMLIAGVTSSLISCARAWVGVHVSTNFNLQWMGNVFSHLLRLPVDYFERRHLGDIVAKFDSIRLIEQSLTGSVVNAILDGLLAVVTLVMMFVYIPSLAAIAAGAVAIYALLRYLRYEALRNASANAIAKHAKVQTYFLETIRGIRSIKLLLKENERRSGWLNLMVTAQNAGLVGQRLNLIFATSWSLIGSIERCFILWLGASAVIDDHLSIGMFFAYMAYKEQFSARAIQLVDRIAEFNMLNVQGERLADIVLSQPEEADLYRENRIPESHDLRLENINYRYAQGEKKILLNASLSIEAGSCIAITGPSGCGKSTCLKIMLGILKPNGGSVMLGGVPIFNIGVRNYRGLIASVMQDDHLFAGTVFDNIAFLDERPDEEWVHECATMANIHAEIAAMPMGYHTLVGDMGSILSGGQKQRLLLARALYTRPKILFLDEATSHLDVDNERLIGEAIAKIKITRVIIAHRPQTIAIADTVVLLQDGSFKVVRDSTESGENVNLLKLIQ